MDTQTLLLIVLGDFEKPFLESLARDVAQEFRREVSVAEGHINLTDHFNSMRRQYDANGLLQALEAPGPYLKKIGLFRVDLFIPILTYIFGQATLSGDRGVASLYRLRNEVYGMAKDEALLRERFTKVVIHELGHTFGLVHCYQPVCIMRSSTYVEDLDQKSLHFCNRCREQLNGV